MERKANFLHAESFITRIKNTNLIKYLFRISNAKDDCKLYAVSLDVLNPTMGKGE